MTTVLSLLVKLLQIEDALTLLQLVEDEEMRTLIELASIEGFNDVVNLSKLLLGPRLDEEELWSRVSSSRFAPLAIAVATIVAVALGRYATNTLCVRLSKVFERYLSNLSDFELQRIARAVGMDLTVSDRCLKEILTCVGERGEVLRTCYRYAVRVSHYLTAISGLAGEPSWKLINQVVDRGKVFIEKRDRVDRLLAEFYRVSLQRKLLRLARDDEVRNFVRERIEGIELVKKILEELGSPKSVTVVTTAPTTEGEEVYKPIASPERIEATDIATGSPQPVVLENVTSVEQLIELARQVFPPCMKSFVEALLNGENLSHHQRFALAAFLVNLGIDLEVILDLFRRSPDFNERIARYQIEHIAGLRGSKKRYLPYNCSTMQSLGLCPSPGCGVKNPLTYVRRALRRAVKSSGDRSTSHRVREARTPG